MVTSLPQSAPMALLRLHKTLISAPAVATIPPPPHTPPLFLAFFIVLTRMASSSVDSFTLHPHFLHSAADSSNVSQEEFKMFHSIDRDLFTRLVFAIGRDPGETMQVMALWLWLEDSAPDPYLVKKLLDLPDPLLCALFDEALLCLRCVESDTFAASLYSAQNGKIIPLTESLTGGGAVSLRFFHDHRLSVLRGVTKIVNEVCVRAFEDIILNATAAAAESTPEEAGPGFPAFMSHIVGPNPTGQFLVTGNVAGDGTNVGTPARVQLWGACDPFDLGAQREMVSNELGELLLSRVNLVASSEEENSSSSSGGGGGNVKDPVVPQDDRTIFLTFSKGYPISESEVRDFFTKKFGECIDVIYMQEVAGEEQVLYARLVVRPNIKVEEVLEGKSKAKFSINGKHVWARKYVRKQSKTSPKRQHSPASSAVKEDRAKRN